MGPTRGWQHAGVETRRLEGRGGGGHEDGAGKQNERGKPLAIFH